MLENGNHRLRLRMNRNSKPNLSPVRPVTIFRNVLILFMSFIILSDFSFSPTHGHEQDLYHPLVDDSENVDVGSKLTKLNVFLQKWLMIELIEVVYKFGLAFRHDLI